MAKTVKIAKTDAKKAAKKAAAELQKKLEATVKAAYEVDPTIALAPFLARPFSKNGIDAVATDVHRQAAQRRRQEVDLEASGGQHEAGVR